MKGLIICCVVLLSSCALTPAQRPDFCEGQQSYIYDLADKLRVDPETISSTLVIVNYEAIKNAPLYTEDACRGAIKNIRLLIESGTPSYYQIMTLMSQNIDYVNKYAGTEIMLIGLFVPQLSYKVPITDCDRRCILWHLDQQDKMLDSFFGKSGS